MPDQPPKNLLAPESTLLYDEFEPDTPKRQEIAPGIEPSPADSDEDTSPTRAQPTSKTSKARYRALAEQLRKNLLAPESTLLSDELPRLALVARLVEAAVSLDSAGRKEALTMPDQPPKNLLAPESTLLYDEFEPDTPKRQEIAPGIEPSPADSDEDTSPTRAQPTSKTSKARYRALAEQLRKNLLAPESTLLYDEFEPDTPKRQEIAPGIEPSPEPASKTSEVRYR